MTNYTENKSNTRAEEFRLAFYDCYLDVSQTLVNFFKNFKTSMKNIWLKMRKSDAWQVVGLSSFVAFFCFIYALINNSFTVPVNGDFQLQGMTFVYNGYDDWHYFFSTGTFPEWDMSGLIGVSNINAYSFYYLFDPFFLVMLIFPRAWLSQIQAILMMVKLVLGALFFYYYLGSFHITKGTRKIGALAYGFCGWGWFYLWFFHFPEVLTFFPLMLWGIEKIFNKHDPRLFIVSCFLMGCTNYQFLAIFLICSFIYAMFKFFATIKKRDGKENGMILGLGVFGFLMGILTCAFIIIPNFISIQSMPRIAVSGSSYLDSIKAAESLGDKLKLIFTWDDGVKYRHMYPLASLIFMNSSCFSSALYNVSGYDNAGISMYMFSPLLLMIVPSLIDSIVKKKWSHVIAFVLVAISIETPFIYYMSGLFANYYGRWELFPLLLMILFVTLHFDDLKKMPGWYLDLSAVIVAVGFALVVYVTKNDADAYNSLSPINSYRENLIIFQGIWLFGCYLFLRFRRTSRTFKKETLYVVALEAIILGNVSVTGQGYTNYSSSLFGGHANTVDQTQIVSELQNWDDSTSEYRIFNTQATRSQNNLSMVEGYNGTSLFCSVYNYETNDFFCWSRISYGAGADYQHCGWSFGNHEKRYNLDSFLGVKYYLVGKKNSNGFISATNSTMDKNIPYGYTDVTTLADCPQSLKDKLYSSENPNNTFALYRNDNYIDLAFAYDDFITADAMSFSSNATNDNEINYLKHAIVDTDYYAANKDKFSEFTKTNKNYMSSVTSFTKGAYYANWDTSEQGGGYRTLNSNYPDSVYRSEHASELEQDAYNNPSSYSVNEDGYIQALGGSDQLYIYPGDTKQSSMLNLSYNSKIYGENTNPSKPLAAPEASSKNGAFVSIQSKFGYNIDFHLFGYDSEQGTYHELTHDMHMYNSYSKGGDWKYSRGFYVEEPVYKVVGVLKETLGNKNNAAQNTNTTLDINSISYEYNTEYQEDIDKLKADEVNVTYQDANNIKYTSNYSKDKIVVLNVPYDLGWKLKKTYLNEENVEVTEDVEYFKGQGGFISYFGDKGNVSYSLSYKTPGLNTGLLLTGVGFSGTFLAYGLWFGTHILSKYYKKYTSLYSLKDL